MDENKEEGEEKGEEVQIFDTDDEDEDEYESASEDEEEEVKYIPETPPPPTCRYYLIDQNTLGLRNRFGTISYTPVVSCKPIMSYMTDYTVSSFLVKE